MKETSLAMPPRYASDIVIIRGEESARCWRRDNGVMFVFHARQKMPSAVCHTPCRRYSAPFTPCRHAAVIERAPRVFIRCSEKETFTVSPLRRHAAYFSPYARARRHATTYEETHPHAIRHSTIHVCRDKIYNTTSKARHNKKYRWVKS